MSDAPSAIKDSIGTSSKMSEKDIEAQLAKLRSTWIVITQNTFSTVDSSVSFLNSFLLELNQKYYKNRSDYRFKIICNQSLLWTILNIKDTIKLYKEPHEIQSSLLPKFLQIN